MSDTDQTADTNDTPFDAHEAFKRVQRILNKCDAATRKRVVAATVALYE